MDATTDRRGPEGAGITADARHLFDRVDRRVTDWMTEHGPMVVRASLGLVFVWFGALKLLGVSPVEGLSKEMLYWFSPELFVWLEPGWVVPIFGAFEVAIGALLLGAIALRVTLAIFWLHLLGTFSVLVIRPDLAYRQGNPLLLTELGEFVVKNVVLIAAGIVVGSTVRSERG